MWGRKEGGALDDEDTDMAGMTKQRYKLDKRGKHMAHMKDSGNRR